MSQLTWVKHIVLKKINTIIPNKFVLGLKNDLVCNNKTERKIKQFQCLI